MLGKGSEVHKQTAKIRFYFLFMQCVDIISMSLLSFYKIRRLVKIGKNETQAVMTVPFTVVLPPAAMVSTNRF
jgi:hypothetical protein